MNDLKWKDKYALDIFAIDLQHKGLFDCFVALAQVLPHKRALPDIALIRLVARLQEHFAIEESMMRTLSYPGFARHAQEHRRFHVEVQRLAREIADAGGNMPSATIKVLRQWLRDHIMTSDRSYLAFFAGPRSVDCGSEVVAAKSAKAQAHAHATQADSVGRMPRPGLPADDLFVR